MPAFNPVTVPRAADATSQSPPPLIPDPSRVPEHAAFADCSAGNAPVDAPTVPPAADAGSGSPPLLNPDLAAHPYHPALSDSSAQPGTAGYDGDLDQNVQYLAEHPAAARARQRAYFSVHTPECQYKVREAIEHKRGLGTG